MDPLFPLPNHPESVYFTGQVCDPCSHVSLSCDAWHGVHDGLPHRTRHNHSRCDGVVLPARHAGALFPIARAGSSSEDREQLEGGQAESPAADRQGLR
jgi:hypothetical protein